MRTGDCWGLGMVGAGEGARAGGSGAGVGGGQPFVDRSKVRILLCDSDPDSSQDVLRLLCNCSYQGQFTSGLLIMCLLLAVLLLLLTDTTSITMFSSNDVSGARWWCCYFFFSVTCAKSPRQVINVLNCEGAEIDIILAEVDLPVSKCFKMLKYIGRNKELRYIPIISKPSSSSHGFVQFLCHACSDDIRTDAITQ